MSLIFISSSSIYCIIEKKMNTSLFFVQKLRITLRTIPASAEEQSFKFAIKLH